MNEEKMQLVKRLVDAIPDLTAGQMHWVNRVLNVFKAKHEFCLWDSDFLNDESLRNFGDAIRIHHGFSAEPFSKDKFEYVFVETIQLSGGRAFLASKGNPGHDVTIGDDVKVSLKTQANRAIKNDSIWVSKFMELGKGQWTDKPTDLERLRDQFFEHMNHYDRVLSLRALEKGPTWLYELVEIPKTTLELARNGELEMKLASKQMPKPGYCNVTDSHGEKIFSLYFDGGSERKLQIKALNKKWCRVHATWRFAIPEV